MASEGLNKPEWLPDTSTESESDRGSAFDPNEVSTAFKHNYVFGCQERIDSTNAPILVTIYSDRKLETRINLNGS